MKKLLLMTVICVAAVACNSPKTYTINGVLEDSTLLADAKMAYLTDYSTSQCIDSVGIVEGKFTFKGTVDSAVVLRVGVLRGFANILSEEGDASIVFKTNDGEVSGGPQNQLLAQYGAEQQMLTKGIIAAMDSLPREKEEERDNIINKYNDDMAALNDKYMNEAEVNTSFKAWMLWQQLMSMQSATVVQIDSMINVAGAIAQRFGMITKIRNTKVALEATQAGSMFVDFDALNPDGTAAKFSNYIGKGNYVLVDFWASWCGPCRAEVPAIKEVYNSYKDKGLVVLGVNVWDKKPDFEKAVTELEMPWAQICNFDNNTPTDTYGINGIPHIILFAPDGTIVERGLRGDTMKSKIAEVYSQK